MKRRIVFVFFLTLLTVFVGIGAQPVGEHVPDLVSLDVYSTNAFHGRLEAGGNPGPRCGILHPALSGAESPHDHGRCR